MRCVFILVKKLFANEFIHFVEKFLENNCCNSCKRIEFDSKSDKQCINNLIEFQPPGWMPQGNVGTTSSFFFKLIRECRLSCSIIRKLNIKFNNNLGGHEYGAVSYSYDDSLSIGEQMQNNTEIDFSNNSILQPYNLLNETPRITMSEAVKLDDIPEEWDRFESLHDDPYNIERGANKSLKYENKVELMWEKGGPGLVHYMDEFAWRKSDYLRKEEFFNEPSSFDLDIDMEHYEGAGLFECATGPGGIALHSKQLMEIQGVTSNITDRKLCVDDARLLSSISGHGYNFARQVLRRFGWRPGQRLGRGRPGTSAGLLSPISIEGSLPPHVRTGFGYYGPRRIEEQVDATRKLPTFTKQDSGLKIRSIFDEPASVPETMCGGLFRADPNLEVKYRSDWIGPKSRRNHSEGVQVPENKLNANRTVIITPTARIGREGILFKSAGLLHNTKR